MYYGNGEKSEYTMHELRNQHVSIGLSSPVRSKRLLCFVQGQG